MRRALASALVVGPVLVGINHADAILSGDVSPGRLLRMALTVAFGRLIRQLGLGRTSTP